MTDNVPAAVPNDHEMMVYQTMAKQAADSKLYRGIGDQAGIMMIMLAARELGISPMQGLNGGLHLIQGKVEISARMMSALIRKQGHSVQIVESSDERCILKGKRVDNGDEGSAEYTIDEAKRAGLVKKGGGWEKHPSDMLFARALSRLARQLFSDVIGVGYVEGEIPREKGVKQPEPEVLKDAEILDLSEETAKFKEEVLKDLKDEERKLFTEYAKVVQGHFKWSEHKVWKTFATNTAEAHQKFVAWKEKRKDDL